jgi:hypothetical protein
VPEKKKPKLNLPEELDPQIAGKFITMIGDELI